MPELSRFHGIVIRMFLESGLPHHRPHFHAYYQGGAAAFGFSPVELIAGALPARQRRLIEAWAALHVADLQLAWDRLQAGLAPLAIAPLP